MTKPPTSEQHGLMHVMWGCTCELVDIHKCVMCRKPLPHDRPAVNRDTCSPACRRYMNDVRIIGAEVVGEI